MGFVKRTFDFIGKHILLIIPMFLASLIPQLLAYLVTGEFFTGVYMKLLDLVSKYIESISSSAPGWLDILNGIGKIISANYPKFGLMVAVMVATSVILNIFIVPGVYGAINRGLSEEKIIAPGFAALFYKNTGKYVLFLLCNLLYWFFWTFAGILILVFVGAVALAIQSIASFLLMLTAAFFIFAVIYLYLIIVLWYPAMAVEGLGIEQALRKSLKITRKILPLILLTYTGALLLSNLVMAAFNGFSISDTGQEVASIFLSVLMAFFLMVYQMVIYKSFVNAEKQAYMKLIELDEEEKRKKSEE